MEIIFNRSPCLWLFSDIWRQSKSAMNTMKVDIHARLMRNYKQVPQWWFLILLVGSAMLSLMLSFVWKEQIQLPWWGMLFAFALAFIITLPVGVIQATTNQVSGNFLSFQCLVTRILNSSIVHILI
jgi:OPT oligopeptide transporter protein